MNRLGHDDPRDYVDRQLVGDVPQPSDELGLDGIVIEEPLPSVTENVRKRGVPGTS